MVFYHFHLLSNKSIIYCKNFSFNFKILIYESIKKKYNFDVTDLHRKSWHNRLPGNCNLKWLNQALLLV